MAPFSESCIVDAHHHFLDPDKSFHSVLKKLGAPTYTAEQYAEHCAGVPIVKTVHVEAMATDGADEVEWVNSLADAGRCLVGGIVANCDLSADNALENLRALGAMKRVRGIRYILDYDGPFDNGKSPTHVWLKDINLDFLRDPQVAPRFERGFSELGQLGLSFDLQCCPAQLPAAAALCSRHPSVRVVIDHMGKPFKLNADQSAADEAAISSWRYGMQLMAALPQVSVKLSMLGFCVPGWFGDSTKEKLVKQLVNETISLFGAKRCMLCSNWHINGVISNSDGSDNEDPTMAELYARFTGWVDHLRQTDRDWLFGGSAAEFYRLES